MFAINVPVKTSLNALTPERPSSKPSPISLKLSCKPSASLEASAILSPVLSSPLLRFFSSDWVLFSSVCALLRSSWYFCVSTLFSPVASFDASSCFCSSATASSCAAIFFVKTAAVWPARSSEDVFSSKELIRSFISESSVFVCWMMLFICALYSFSPSTRITGPILVAIASPLPDELKRCYFMVCFGRIRPAINSKAGDHVQHFPVNGAVDLLPVHSQLVPVKKQPSVIECYRGALTVFLL